MTALHQLDTAATPAAYRPTDTLRTAQFRGLIVAAPHLRNPNARWRLRRRAAPCEDAIGCTADDYAAAA